jgi:hypothetical protein
MELRKAASDLKVQQRLRGWADGLRTLPQKHLKNFKWLLLSLNTTENMISVTGYQNRQEAVQVVAEIETSKRPDIDTVLVWVNSVKRLRNAYPNYYADTKQFLDALGTSIVGK